MISVRFRAAFLAFVLFLIASIAASSQNTIHVPGDQPTIQAGINAASLGDTVLVTPGTYPENITFNGKAITVTSSAGAATTIIDGGGAGSVVTFNQNESSGAVLNGFTIQNGHAEYGAGIYINGASPKITNNVITNNGGIVGIGIESKDGSPLIQGNTVSGNVENMGSSGEGGAIHVSASYGVIVNVNVIGNAVTNNHFDAGGFGGGIFVDYFASVLIQNNYISGNSAYNGGGGIGTSTDTSATVTIVDNIITNNSSGGGGDGGGFYDLSGGPVVFLNNTLYGNSSNGGTSEIATQPYPYPFNSTFENNLVYATSGTAVSCPNTNSLIANNNLVFSVGTASNGTCAPFAPASGNLSADPLFKDLANGDFHLQPGSPAIDAGDISNPALPAQDYAGASRLGDDSGQCNFVIDLGVYESHPAAAGALSLSASSLVFPDTAVGSTSALPLTLTGTGQGCFRITGFQLSGDFAQSGTCGAGVPGGQSCTAQVAFTPTAGGLRSGTLSIPMNTNSGTPVPAVTLSGNGLVPHGTPSPSSLSFPAQNVNSTSPAQTVTLTNDGGATLTVTSVTVTGAFAQTNNCNIALAPGTSCSIQVTFVPTVGGQSYGTLSISSNSVPAIASVSLSGTGVGPQGSLSPVDLRFYQQVVGTTSAAQSVTLTNFGGLDMHISSVSMYAGYGPDFAQTNNCPATLSAGSFCTIQITFTPSTNGWRQGLLTVTSDAPPLDPVTMSGYGANAAPVASPSSVNFGDVLLNQTGTQSVVLTNPGTTTLPINSVTASAPFSASGCAGSINAGASCTITLTWTPQTTGVQNGTLTINSVAITSVQTLTVTGRGVQPALTYSPSPVTFPNQIVGTWSSAQSVTLSNSGTGAYTLQQFNISSSEFNQTNNCPASLAAGATCTINVTFGPSATGTRTATLTASGSPASVGGSVTLSGTGAQAVASLSTSSLSFANQMVGTTSSAQVVTLSNTGNSVLTIASMIAPSPFAESNNCGSSLAAGASCSIDVTFAPTSFGAATGTLMLYFGSTASPQGITLSGTGLAPQASFTPSSVTFPMQRVGTTSPAQVVTLTNTGNSTLTISSIGTAGAVVFSQTNSCPATLASGASCPINVILRSAQTGTYYGEVAIISDTGNVSGTEKEVFLTGPSGASTATPSPTSLSFATTKVGTSSAPASVTITNSGNMALDISSISITGDFSQSNNCGTTVAPSASCSINAVFMPTASGSRGGALTINSDAQNGNVTVSLSGTGAVPIAGLAPSSLTFASIPVGTQSASSAVTLTNSGAVAMNISSILTSGDFAQNNNCASSLPANSSCTINVTFAPTAAGTRTGSLTVTDDATGGSQTASLSGSASDFYVSVSPTSVSINPGQSANYSPKVSATGGTYGSSVALTCSGLPAETTCSFNPIAVVPGSSSQTSKLKITTSTGTPKGTYTIVVSGGANNVTRSATATLIVK